MGGRGEVLMAPIGRWREKSKKRSSTPKVRRNKMSKNRHSLQRGRNSRRPFLTCPRFMKFFNFREMLILQRKNGKRGADLIKSTRPMEPKEGYAAICFWRDPDAKFCTICGDDQEMHLELKCPYNYLSPDAYVPCRARLALWGNYTTTLRYKCPKHNEEEQREPPMHDETNSRRLWFMRCLVRVNNLPERWHPEQVATLFSRFGPLQMWHVATRNSGVCEGYGCVVFQHHEHAEEAIEALNCCKFGERKLRVDWAYPCLNYC